MRNTRIRIHYFCAKSFHSSIQSNTIIKSMFDIKFLWYSVIIIAVLNPIMIHFTTKHVEIFVLSGLDKLKISAICLSDAL